MRMNFVCKTKFLLLIVDKYLKLHIPDKLYLELTFEKRMNKKLNFNNPKTFNEKLQWLKLYNRDEKLINLVDKYKVKQYIVEKIGAKYVIPTIGVYNSFNDINFDKLPNQFVLKCTHDSGGIVICNDKSNFNIKNAKIKINKCLKRNYYYLGREWPYKNVTPRIIVEKYMEDKENKDLIDYKFMCFNGKVECIFTCSERYNKYGLKVTFFNRNWEQLPFERHYKSSNKEIKKPNNLNKMIELSEILSKNFPFVRIDFYEINNNIYFGEFTFFPGSGYEEFNPEEWDLKLGNLIDLSLLNKKQK